MTKHLLLAGSATILKMLNEYRQENEFSVNNKSGVISCRRDKEASANERDADSSAASALGQNDTVLTF